MRASTAVATLALVAAASPAVAAPIGAPAAKREEKVDARAVSLGALGKELGKGALTGGAFAGLAAGAEKLLGGGDQAAQKREFTDEEVELLKRAVSLGALGKELGKGALTGGAFAGLAAGAESLLGGGDQAAQKRGLGGVVGKLVGATEDSVGTVIKNGLAGGLAAGTAIGGVDAATGQKRELDARGGVAGAAEKVAADTIGDTIKKGLTNGVGSALAGTAVGGIINSLSGNQRRELEEILARGGVAGAAEKVAADTIGDTIKKGLTNGVGSALAGTAVGGIINSLSGNQRRELEELLAAREPEPLGAIGKGLLGTGVGLVGSGIAQEAINGVESLVSREPEPLGAVGKGLLGTGVGLVGSGIAQEAIDGIKNLVSRELSLNELD